MHFFQSKLTLVWYGERFHSHSVPISTEITQLRLAPDVAREVDLELMQHKPNYVHHHIQGLAQLGNLSAEQAASLPTRKQLANRRAALVVTRKENDLSSSLEQYS